jgi:hypothetical protein
MLNAGMFALGAVTGWLIGQIVIRDASNASRLTRGAFFAVFGFGSASVFVIYAAPPDSFSYFITGVLCASGFLGLFRRYLQRCTRMRRDSDDMDD